MVESPSRKESVTPEAGERLAYAFTGEASDLDAYGLSPEPPAPLQVAPRGAHLHEAHFDRAALASLGRGTPGAFAQG